MITPTKSDIGRLVAHQNDAGDIYDEGVMTGWNRKHAMVRWHGSDLSEAVEPRFLTWRYAHSWAPALADAIILAVGLWQMNRFNSELELMPEELIVEIAAEREEADAIVPHLIGRLTPRRLALPVGYSCRRQA